MKRTFAITLVTLITVILSACGGSSSGSGDAEATISATGLQGTVEITRQSGGTDAGVTTLTSSQTSDQLTLNNNGGNVTLTITSEPLLQACYFDDAGKQITVTNHTPASRIQISCEDKILFVAGEGYPYGGSETGVRRLYMTDGTPEGTTALTTEVPDLSSSHLPTSNFRPRLGTDLFFKLGSQWEQTDGTPGGTHPVAWGSATTIDITKHESVLYLLQSQTDGTAIVTVIHQADDTPGIVTQLPDSSTQKYLALYAMDTGFLMLRESRSTGGAKSLLFVPYDSSTPAPAAWPFYSTDYVGPTTTGSNAFVGMGTDSSSNGVLFVSDGTETGTGYVSLPISQPARPMLIGHVGAQMVFEIDNRISGHPGLYGLTGRTWTTLDATPCAGKSSKKLSLISLSGSQLTYSCAVTDSKGDILGEDVWQTSDIDKTAPTLLFSYPHGFDGAYFAGGHLIEMHLNTLATPCPMAPWICQKELVLSAATINPVSPSSGLTQIYSATGAISILGYDLPLFLSTEEDASLAIGPYLLFKSYDSAHGWEPWVTDGTAEGTRMLVDSNPGPDDGVPVY